MDFCIYLCDYPAYCRGHNFYLGKLPIFLPNLELPCIMLLMQNCMHACISRSAGITDPDYLVWLHCVQHNTTVVLSSPNLGSARDWSNQIQQPKGKTITLKLSYGIKPMLHLVWYPVFISY